LSKKAKAQCQFNIHDAFVINYIIVFKHGFIVLDMCKSLKQFIKIIYVFIIQ